MYTTSGFLTYLSQRLDATGRPAIALVTLAVVLVALLALVSAGEILAATTEPMQVAPFRWLRRA